MTVHVSTADPPTEAEPLPPPGPRWVFFACGPHMCAVPLVRVREVLTPQPFTRLPGCGPEVCGLIGRRGHVITAFDLGVVLGPGASTDRGDHRLLVAEMDERVIAVAVDDVVTIANVWMDGSPDDAVAVGPDGLRRGDALGAGTIDGRRFVALDLDPILTRLLV
jgi:chemotaxis signal transduction protein